MSVEKSFMFMFPPQAAKTAKATGQPLPADPMAKRAAKVKKAGKTKKAKK